MAREAMGKPAERDGPSGSIIIPTYNRGPYLVNTLTTLAQQEHDPDDFEVVVTDDGSTDGTRAMVERLDLPYRLTYIEKPNRNCRSEARNVAVLAARGEVLIFLDSEMLCPPGFVDAHLDLHRRYGPCAVCGCHKRLPGLPGGPLPADWWEAVEQAGPLRGCYPGINSGQFLVPFITANSSCLRADAIEVGLFDQAFIGYGHEDLDLGMRLYLLGRRVIACPTTMAYHQRHPKPPQIADEVGRNSRYYYRKHHHRRHVIHFVDALYAGGAERILLSLARHLHGGQHLFTIVTHEGVRHYAEDFASLGVPIVRLQPPDLDGFLASRPVDLIHIHYSPTHWAAYLLGSNTRAPMLATVHSAVRLAPHRRLRAISCLGHSILALQPGPPEHYRVIRPGTDPERFAPQGRKREMRECLGLPQDAFVIGTAIRVDEDKVSTRMLAVYVELVRLRPDMHVVLLGDGFDLRARRGQVAALGLSDRIHLPGPVRDVSAHLEAFDVFVHAVEQEAFGVAVLEALAKGLPVVAPKAGGMRETVVDGECGFLCETGDALIRRVLELADGVHDMGRLSRNAIRRARLFDERRTALKYKLLYDEVIDGARYGWPAPDAHAWSEEHEAISSTRPSTSGGS
jgi:glycosyltransferase involved in cell wall biosynthesis